MSLTAGRTKDGVGGALGAVGAAVREEADERG